MIAVQNTYRQQKNTYTIYLEHNQPWLYYEISSSRLDVDEKKGRHWLSTHAAFW